MLCCLLVSSSCGDFFFFSLAMTVFHNAQLFEGDLRMWDVSQVTTMYASKLCGSFVSRIVNGMREEKKWGCSVCVR